jgi:antitoxin (DNA-binding transcriptional repressor) of toxin-antitoxin stability system
MPFRQVYAKRMSKTVTITEAQTKLGQLFEMAQAGHEIIIEDAKGKARLVPMHATTGDKKCVLGLHQGEAWMSTDFNAPLADYFWSDDERK